MNINIRFFVILLCIAGLLSTANAQKAKTTQDSIKVFYDKIFKSFEVAYVHKKITTGKS